MALEKIPKSIKTVMKINILFLSIIAILVIVGIYFLSEANLRMAILLFGIGVALFSVHLLLRYI